jgi:hypothetical protein
MRPIRRLVLTWMLTLPLTALACPPEPAADALDPLEAAKSSALYGAALAADGDARSKFALAQFLSGAPWRDSLDPTSGHARLAEALDPGAEAPWLAARRHVAAVIAAGPDDPWIAARVLNDVEAPADRKPWLARVAEAAAADGYFALVMSGQPEVRDNPAAVALWIARAANAPAFSTAFTAETPGLSRRFQAAAAATGFEEAQAPAFAPISAIALAMFAYPPVTPWFPACKAAQGDLRATCRVLAQRLLADGTVLDASLGASLGEYLADDDRERAQARAAKRQVQWLSAGSTEMVFDAKGATPAELAYLAAFAQGDELEALRAFRRARGEPVTPPDGWEPKKL